MCLPPGMSKFQVLSFIFVLFFLLGMLNIYFSDREENCSMTYMFEYPQFVRIPVPENEVYPQYGLYAYSEGRLTEKVRKMWFDGIPVLFLPGNAGSYKQARSLASVALKKASNKDSHFDYFTVSYNSELSGFYGGVLYHEMNFTAACISKILSLYTVNKHKKSVPDSVILIGHSMGGVIAKRLLALPSTLDTTSIAITLSSPLESPPINMDLAMDNFYARIEADWKENIRNDSTMRAKKILLSLGGGPRDVLVSSRLTSSKDSFINALTTAVPGVWVSPDHVSIVWCKQLVLVINRYLFDIVDPASQQIFGNTQLLRSKAVQYFQGNRSIYLNPNISRALKPMVVDAFWHEDFRTQFQLFRQEIHKTTYLMVRLERSDNRLIVVETINVDDKDWIFGCNAEFERNNYRYCKEGTSLTEFSRWTGVANPEAGKRKLAILDLQDIWDNYPDWTHIVFKISPSRKPIALNADFSNLVRRQVVVNPGYTMLFSDQVVVYDTPKEALYFELIIRGLDTVHDAFLLYLEPSKSCKNVKYHVSAQLHVPWAENHEQYHYFTHLKRAPMKLTVFKTNPSVIDGSTTTDFVKVKLILDPVCTYEIRLSSSWYHRLGQFVRHYSPALIPYMAAIVLLAARSNLLHLYEHDSCVSSHTALSSDGLRPYYVLVYARFCVFFMTSFPLLSCISENITNNLEIQYFVRSIFVVPMYMIALGLVNLAVAALLAFMVFSSQIAHRLFFRIMWRGRAGLAEKVAGVLKKVPTVVSLALLFTAQACGAAALAAGAAFYGFMISKMYEEYLEDYFYKLLARVSAKTWQFVTSKTRKNVKPTSSAVATASETDTQSEERQSVKNEKDEVPPSEPLEKKAECKSGEPEEEKNVENKNEDDSDVEDEIDEDLSNLNFHMMLFLMWLMVTLINLPALLIWAKNFKHSKVLVPDTSYPAGLILSACSFIIWQRNGPKRNLRHYEITAAMMFGIATFMIVIGPFTLVVVNYGITFMFLMLTMQQLFDIEDYNDPSGETGDINNELAEINDSSNEASEKENSNNTSGEQEDSNNASGEQKDSNNAPGEKASKGENMASECAEPNVPRQRIRKKNVAKESSKEDSERMQAKHSFTTDDFSAP